MAYTEIPAILIGVGKALKKGLMDNIRDNFIDHETRINGLEAGAEKVEIFNFEVMGFINDYSAAELVQIGTHIVSLPLNITEVTVVLMNGSSSPSTSSNGVTQLDLDVSSDNGLTWDTILTKKANIPEGENTTGYKTESVTFTTNGEILAIDDILRVNIISKKDVQGSFLIQVYGELNT